MYVLSKLDIEKGIILPEKITPDIAEIVGIHFGDGCMQKDYRQTYKVSYALGTRMLRERKYIEYVKIIFKKTFGFDIRTYVCKNKNAVILYFFSKNLCYYFNKKLKIPFSPKNDLIIPQYILENEEFLCRFLKGLFDTDGCFTKQRCLGKYVYDLAKISIKSRVFAEQIKESLSLLGMRSYICSKKKGGYDVTMRRKESFKLFVEKVSPEKKKWDY
ncbi:MAG: hypothetical protein OXR66_02975 [Candidatus Woesearchaeota archaeon]|nr:hypothetical protein [Candidatus Woesearchaeota archaeon]